MKSTALTCFVVCLVIFAKPIAAVEDSDHLLPARGAELYPKYQKVLDQKIGGSSFDAGRMTVLASFEPEESVSISLRKTSAKRAAYWVTYVRANANLWQAMDGGTSPEKAAAVTTHQIQVQIPEETGRLLRSVWLKMLSGENGPRPTPKPRWVTIPVDAATIEFSIEGPGHKVVHGELIQGVPFAGERTKTFVAIGRALLEYCKADSKQRPAILEKINKKASRLLEMLKSNH